MMKKNNLFRIGARLFPVIAVMAIMAIFSGIAAFGGSVIYAITGAVVSGEPVTVEEVKAGSPDLDRDYVSKKITEMRPAATPLDTIMRNMRTAVSIDSFRTDYYAVDSRPLYDTVKTAYTATGDGQLTYDLAVNNIAMWSTADDTCMLTGITGGDSMDLVCFIISKNISNGTIKIQPINGLAGSGTTANELILPTSIPVGTRVVRMGAAKNELDAQASPFSIIPVKDYNYAQIFMAQVEEGTYQKIHAKEVDWNFSDYEAQNIYDMKAGMEFSGWFGARAMFYDHVNAKLRYTMGGVTRFITKGLTYGAGGTDRSIDNATFVDWTKSVFTGNSGSDTRFLFAGDGLVANLSKVDTIMKQIEAKKTEVKFGITFKQIETNFGIINLKHTPIFDQAGWGDNGVILDLNNIEKHTFRPMNTTILDLKKSGQRNVDAVVIEECSTIVTRYPDTHAIIRPTA